MKNFMKRVTGVLMATMIAGVPGTAAAEIDCSADTLDSLSKENRIERAYACADKIKQLDLPF
jgi:hypothetical protein